MERTDRQARQPARRPTPLVAACLGIVLSAGPAVAEPLTLMLGENGNGRIDLVFQSDMTATDSFELRTDGVAVPGSRIMVSIDGVPYDLVDHVLTEDDCRFAAEREGALCTIAIEGSSRAYRDLVAAFKAGLVAHLDVTNAGHPVMREDTSLDGFTAAFRSL